MFWFISIAESNSERVAADWFVVEAELLTKEPKESKGCGDQGYMNPLLSYSASGTPGRYSTSRKGADSRLVPAGINDHSPEERASPWSKTGGLAWRV
ncbi:hypothetical protein SUGI_0647060 [Cryptomeria japonica]|nr:hypothetical protein SUGI_0647060 [Cryptomeria japonica]